MCVKLNGNVFLFILFYFILFYFFLFYFIYIILLLHVNEQKFQVVVVIIFKNILLCLKAQTKNQILLMNVILN